MKFRRRKNVMNNRIRIESLFLRSVRKEDMIFRMIILIVIMTQVYGLAPYISLKENKVRKIDRLVLIN